LHCQDLETLEIQESCVNSKPADAPFTCDQIDTFMFGKILSGAGTDNMTVLDTWVQGFVDSPAIVYGQPDPKLVEENWKKELQTLGAPQMVGIFNFDSQPYSNSLKLQNNGPEIVHNALSMTPYCLEGETDQPSSGIEQLDTLDPNYMLFENHKSRYALDLRKTLTSLQPGENSEIPTQSEAILMFGWAETFKDMNFLKNKPFTGTKYFDYLTLASAADADANCKKFTLMPKIVTLRHVAEIKDNVIVDSKVELVFFGKSTFPRRDQYIMREEIAEGSYSYVLRMKIDRKDRKATFNFKDGFGKEVQYDTTADEFAQMVNPVIFIGNTMEELEKTDPQSENLNYAFYKYRYRTFGVARGVTNHDLCKGASDFSENPTDLALNDLGVVGAVARRAQAAGPESVKEELAKNGLEATPAVAQVISAVAKPENYIFCPKSEKMFFTQKETVQCGVPEYTEEAICYNQPEETGGKCLQCRRGYFLSLGQCQQCTDSNCDVCSLDSGNCTYCKEGFEMQIDESNMSRKCVECHSNTYWDKSTGACTEATLSQYAIFAEGANV
jgi:hypothetical protein